MAGAPVDPSRTTGGYPATPDGRYFVVRGRLWRMSDPRLDAAERARLTRVLMQARREVGAALRASDAVAVRAARKRVDAAKVALGERGAPWWSDGAPDYNRRMARTTPYAGWHAELDEVGGASPISGPRRAAPGRAPAGAR